MYNEVDAIPRDPVKRRDPGVVYVTLLDAGVYTPIRLIRVLTSLLNCKPREKRVNDTTPPRRTGGVEYLHSSRSESRQRGAKDRGKCGLKNAARTTRLNVHVDRYVAFHELAIVMQE